MTELNTFTFFSSVIITLEILYVKSVDVTDKYSERKNIFSFTGAYMHFLALVNTLFTWPVCTPFNNRLTILKSHHIIHDVRGYTVVIIQAMYIHIKCR